MLTKSFQQIPIRLETAQLNAFLLDGHTFVTIFNDTTRFNPLPDDIYDLLFNSTPIKVFAKRTKNIRSPLHAENQDTILSHAYYYVR